MIPGRVLRVATAGATVFCLAFVATQAAPEETDVSGPHAEVLQGWRRLGPGQAGGLHRAGQETIALEYKVLLFQDGKESPVNPKTYQFKLGDRIRVSVEPFNNYYVYIFHVGDQRRWRVSAAGQGRGSAPGQGRQAGGPARQRLPSIQRAAGRGNPAGGGRGKTDRRSRRSGAASWARSRGEKRHARGTGRAEDAQSDSQGGAQVGGGNAPGGSRPHRHVARDRRRFGSPSDSLPTRFARGA